MPGVGGEEQVGDHMGHINAWIQALGGVYGQYGYALVLLGALGENTALLGLALPGGTMTLLGAFYARQGTLNPWLVLLAAWFGTVAGYHVDYLVGRFLLVRLASRWESTGIARRVRLAARLRLARRFLRHHGGKAILLSHVVGHVRSFVALTTGVTAMSYRRFLAFELLAAFIWSALYCSAGYLVGSEWERLQGFFERFGLVAVGVVLLAYLLWKVNQTRRTRQRQARRAARRALGVGR